MSQAQQSDKNTRQTASIRHSWRTALLLMACFILAQADKQVVGLLAVPIQQALDLSDTQLGFFQGGAFAIAFALGGLPIAHLLDSGHRIRIAAICVAAWSMATILSGFAGAYLALLLCRAATAFAEAGLPPATFSIFSQSGHARISARLTGTFMLAPFIGGGAAMLIGGLILDLAAQGQLTLFGYADGWRIVFFTLGLPGIAMAAALLVLGHEPARPIAPAPRYASPHAAMGYRAVIHTIFRQDSFLRRYYLAMASFYLFTAALIGWYPTFLVRAHGLSTSQAGTYAGLAFLVCGVAGTLAATIAAGWRKNLTRHDIASAYGAIITVLLPISVALPIVNSAELSLLCYGLYAFLSAAILAVMSVPIQQSLPNNMQARGVALFSLVVSAISGSLGPLIVGMMSDILPFNLASAMAITAALSSSAALLFIARANAGKSL